MTAVAPSLVITGETRLYAFLGHPVGQARTPHLINPMFRARGVDAVMYAADVAPADLDAAVAGFKAIRNLDGLVVTVPHKAAIVKHADTVLTAGREVGAVNILRREADGRWTADMLDGFGFVNGMRARGHEPAGRSFLMLGAGGAGAAIAHAVAGAGARRITVFDVDDGRAAALVRRVSQAHPLVCVEVGAPVPDGHDTVVNCTPLGMKADDPLPIDPATLGPGLLVIDIIMKPPVTRLLKEAAARGCAVHEGAHMLDGQIGAFVTFFLG